MLENTSHVCGLLRLQSYILKYRSHNRLCTVWSTVKHDPVSLYKDSPALKCGNKTI